MLRILTVLSLAIGLSTAVSANQPARQSNDLLVKLASPMSAQQMTFSLSQSGLKSTVIAGNWIRVQGSQIHSLGMKSFLSSSAVEYVQPNYKINVIKNPNLEKLQKQALALLADTPESFAPIHPDNPEIPSAPSITAGADTLFSKQWGMIDIGVKNAWNIHSGNEIVVAVIDTGVDYTHEDLLPNMWRNTKEIPNNNLDDDNNGYIDDIVGWDFLSNDNKPYDLATADLGEIMKGKNPGHGTHCAGNVAAAGNNGKGISGVAPKAKIMALRFIGDEGGTTAAAIASIKYAVDNGAKVLSNSWGSEGEDSEDPATNKALQDIIQYAQDHNVLFVAAAGNSSRNNDTDPLKAFPASYLHENIISVAAVDSANKIAGFSNFGAANVDLGAPGVKIFSTTVGNRYSDSVIELLQADWSGTSMACPHVAGAAALYWSAHPEKNWKDVKTALLNSVRKIPALDGKTLTGGKLSVEDLMKQ